MDHKEQHHEHHRKEREQYIHRRKARAAEKKARWIHPAWYVILGVIVALIALLVWTFAV
jgi:hypothetical protein